MATDILTETVEKVEIIEFGTPGPPGPPVRIVTTNPMIITNGKIELPSPLLGDVILSTALVFVDIQPSDLDPITGGLIDGKNYVADEYIVRTLNNAVIFDDSVADGRYAMVSYLTPGA